MSDLLSVAFGWALGIGSHFIIDTIKRTKEEREVRAALKVELSELEYRMATAVLQLDSQLGQLNRATLELIRPTVERYEGANYSDSLLGLIDGMLKLSEAELSAQVEAQKIPVAIIGIALQKYELPFLGAKLSSLSFFEDNAALQSRLLEVRASLALFNDLVEQSRFYSRLTFNNGLSTANFERATENRTYCYRNASLRAKVLIRHIGEIKW